MEAIVLAGGFGTRLSSVVSDVCKPMAPVLDKPFLYYILRNLKRHKFKKVILAVGYLKGSIIDYFGFNYEGMKLIYSIEDEPLGTGGAIKKALKYVTDKYVYIINGDTYFDIDYKMLIPKDDMVMVCRYSFDARRYDTVVIEEMKAIDFKKNEEYGFINGGIYVVNKEIFNTYSMEKFSFENDFLKNYINALNVWVYISNTYFIDIGIPSDYYKFIEDVKNEEGSFFR